MLYIHVTPLQFLKTFNPPFMSKKILLHIFTILSLCQLINFAAFCQKTNYAGIGIVPELTGSNDVSAGLTLTLERKITHCPLLHCQQYLILLL